jgi:hypothetical protein
MPGAGPYQGAPTHAPGQPQMTQQMQQPTHRQQMQHIPYPQQLQHYAYQQHMQQMQQMQQMQHYAYPQQMQQYGYQQQMQHNPFAPQMQQNSVAQQGQHNVFAPQMQYFPPPYQVPVPQHQEPYSPQQRLLAHQHQQRLRQSHDDDVMFVSSRALSRPEARDQEHTATPHDQSSAETSTPALPLRSELGNNKKRKAPTKKGEAAPKKKRKSKKRLAQEAQDQADFQARADARAKAEAEAAEAAAARAAEIANETPSAKARRERLEQEEEARKAKVREEERKKADAQVSAFEEEYRVNAAYIDDYYIIGDPSRRSKDPIWQKMLAWNNRPRNASKPAPPPPFPEARRKLASKGPKESVEEVQEEPQQAAERPLEPCSIIPLPRRRGQVAMKVPKKRAQKGLAEQSAATPRAQTPTAAVSPPASAQVSPGPMSPPGSPLQMSRSSAPAVRAPTPHAQTPTTVVSSPVPAQVSPGAMSVPGSPLQIIQSPAPAVRAPTPPAAEKETEEFDPGATLVDGLTELEGFEVTPATPPPATLEIGWQYFVDNATHMRWAVIDNTAGEVTDFLVTFLNLPDDLVDNAVESSLAGVDQAQRSEIVDVCRLEQFPDREGFHVGEDEEAGDEIEESEESEEE